ncbi:MAG: NAD(P)-binding domain-containing protein, partial [Chitinophagaceae bacterium]|nr:NAD(P)-binding domain-containing protein [Chitinophagaceae bacterium]
MKSKSYHTVVVGAGHAGLAASYYLKQSNINHVVFERGRIGESWLSQRWDSFKLNSPNKINCLPGQTQRRQIENEFSSHLEFASSLKQYAIQFQLPVQENTCVISIEKTETKQFRILINRKGREEELFSSHVIIASGLQNEKKLPAFSAAIPSSILQLHASEYRSPNQIKSDAVLIVGSAQSGCQIAADLVEAGKIVFLSTSKVGRLPRWYRGRDVLDWLFEMKFFDMRPQDVPDPAMLHSTAPQLTGVGDGKSTISLQHLASKAVTLLGRVANATRYELSILPNLKENIQTADSVSANIKEMIDGFITKMNTEEKLW